MTRHWHVLEAVVFSKKVACVTYCNSPEHNEGCLAEINIVMYCYATFTVYNELVNDVKLLRQFLVSPSNM